MRQHPNPHPHPDRQTAQRSAAMDLDKCLDILRNRPVCEGSHEGGGGEVRALLDRVRGVSGAGVGYTHS